MNKPSKNSVRTKSNANRPNRIPNFLGNCQEVFRDLKFVYECCFKCHTYCHHFCRYDTEKGFYIVCCEVHKKLIEKENKFKGAK